jgi:hypothetical protein
MNALVHPTTYQSLMDALATAIVGPGGSAS